MVEVIAVPACIRRFKGWSVPTAAGQAEQAHVKVPVESAARLRLFEREDVTQLVTETQCEKQELLDANAALRQVRSCLHPLFHLTQRTLMSCQSAC